MGKWFMSREAQTAAEALTREQTLRVAIKEVDDFGRNTLVGLVKDATVAMNRIAVATEGCLSKQNGQVRPDVVKQT